MIMNYTIEIKNVGNMLNKQVKATDNTNDARRLLATAMQDGRVDMNNQALPA